MKENIQISKHSNIKTFYEYTHNIYIYDVKTFVTSTKYSGETYLCLSGSKSFFKMVK